MWYSTLFLRLYSKILEDDLIKSDVNEGDVQQAIRYMHEVYRGNPENLSKESYSITNYNNLAYRCAYLFKYAPIHTALVYEAMSRALTENPHTFRLFQDLVFLKTPFNICSLGSGPGTDVIGVLAAMYDKLCFFPSSATLVDIMPEWEGTFRSVVSELRLEDRTYGILSASASQRYFDWSFIDSDLLEEVSQDLKLVIESANLITLVKFVSAVACKKTSEMIEKIFQIMRPGAMVLFIDNAGGGFQELITSAAKKHHLVPIFEPLNHELYVNDTFNREKFGYKSCYKTRVAVQLLMKIDPVQYSTGMNLSSQLYPTPTIYPQGQMLQHRFEEQNIRMPNRWTEALMSMPIDLNTICNADARRVLALRRGLNRRGFAAKYPNYFPFFS
ncbi:hypothetical protein AVEN_142084-1 [Araneus ventricosus]|uniref:Methyltransferase-like protein 17, mitochondrial n=1 Tax=Araneus ventricosus TaxID=182803 RepID=A0A4Y2N6A0_ARAVE|nr:hypothetical protein AVEN_142084-1 [Araneus ventricosus]